jgi:hypothetical protein
VIKYGLPLIVALLSQNALGQTNTCGIAVAQLQNYIMRVNDMAVAEYYQNIPIRCGGNPYCMQGSLGELSHWYLQQAALVEEWYSQIIRECTQQSTTRQIPSRRPPRDEPGKLDEDTIKDLRVDDEDRTVRIRIPSTPRGFR